MLAQRLIERKRDGGRIESGEWRALVHAYAAGHAGDPEMAALLMAVYLRGLDGAETHALTEALLGSGAGLLIGAPGSVQVGEHSTGGVGDKVTLVLAPLVASLGVAVPLVCTRALGTAGAMVDKLKSIPGFRTDISISDARAQMERIGCVMMGPTAEIAPAERKISVLRNATATDESAPLVASGVMSAALSAGLSGLVLDVKRGSGSVAPALDDAIDLAQLLIALGSDHGCETVALVTAMDRPLGRAVGSALELEEAIHALRGEGPPDLRDVTYALGAEMLLLARAAPTREEACRQMQTAISSGAAARCFQEIIEAQGGNPGVVDDPAVLPQSEECELYQAPKHGFVARVEPRAVARGLAALGGGGRLAQGDALPAVGFVISAKPGDWVEPGEPLATIFARTPQDIAAGRAALGEAIKISDDADPPLPLVSHRVAAGEVSLYDQEIRGH